MRIRGTQSTRSGIAGSAKRILLGFGYLVACATVPLVAIWPAGDPHPQTTAMILAADQGNVAAIDEILRDGLDVEARDDTGTTPLMAAARSGRIDAVRKLLAAGARIDACNPVTGTALMAATHSGYHDVMRELITRGANVDAASPTGQTALWWARIGGDEGAVRILIAAGARAEGPAAVLSDRAVIKRGADTRTSGETRATVRSSTARPVVPAPPPPSPGAVMTFVPSVQS